MTLAATGGKPVKKVPKAKKGGVVSPLLTPASWSASATGLDGGKKKPVKRVQPKKKVGGDSMSDAMSKMFGNLSIGGKKKVALKKVVKKVVKRRGGACAVGTKCPTPCDILTLANFVETDKLKKQIGLIGDLAFVTDEKKEDESAINKFNTNADGQTKAELADALTVLNLDASLDVAGLYNGVYAYLSTIVGFAKKVESYNEMYQNELPFPAPQVTLQALKVTPQTTQLPPLRLQNGQPPNNSSGGKPRRKPAQKRKPTKPKA